jgi:uncharacterized repeat protein (TIGR03803 family)
MGYNLRCIAKVLRHSTVRFRARAAAASVVCAATVCPAFAQVTETVLHTFLGGSDGGIVYAPLIADFSGPQGALTGLYGTTGYGGGIDAPNCVAFFGCGTVFKLTPTPRGQTPWTETVLGSFSGGSNGDLPIGGLFASREKVFQTASLYGTTSGFNEGTPGTVFKLTGQTLTTIYNFTGGSDGASPTAGLIANEPADAKGALYGTAVSGGSNGCGTVYRVTPPKYYQTAWTEQTLWGFSGENDGCGPQGILLADKRGALYGTAYAGGASNNGVIFKLTPPEDGKTAWTEQTLWSFSGGSDGGGPAAGLIADWAGALYGTASAGGSGSHGTVFKLTPPEDGKTAWTEQTLWSFSGGSDGASPNAGPIADRAGALYGTAVFGGKIDNVCFGGNGNGVVFKLSPPKRGQTAWTHTTLWAFSGGTDGCLPNAPLVADNRGAIYGTTLYGGFFSGNLCIGIGCGVVFRLTGTGFVPTAND